MLKPGLTTGAVDRMAEKYIREHGGTPAFKGYRGFPASLCISLNAEVVHGIPGDREIREGDVVSVDCGVVLEGYVGDSAYTFAMRGVEAETMNLLRTTKECLARAIAVCRPGNRIGDIGAAVQDCAQDHGYGVVRELVGHGVGRALHEKPEVPNYGQRGTGARLKPGMVIAIEPMINRGAKEVETLADGWTVVAADGLPSGHYEHVVAITETGCEVLSSFDAIEAAEQQNEYLDAQYYEAAWPSRQP
jgi:methionyl aminopeptidase